MTRRSRAVLIDLSEHDRILNENYEEYCNTFDVQAARPTLEQLKLTSDGVMDFGFCIGNLDSEQIYRLAENSGSVVGYGYLIAPELDCRNTQPINVGDKEIGLIREVAKQDGTKYLFIKIDGQRIGFQHKYLTSTCEVIPNPNTDLYHFSVEIQEIDRYPLFSCYLKRFRIVKKPHDARFFDSCVGDEIFDDSREELDILSKTLIGSGVSEDVYYALRKTSAAVALDARFKQIVTKEVEVTEACQGIVLRRRRHGRIFDYFQDIVSKVPVKSQSAVYNTIPRKVLNKVSLNFVNAPELTSQLLKTNLGYINNCMMTNDNKDKEFSLVQDGIPAIIYCIKETKCLESLLASSLASNDAELITALKKGGFKVAPEGLKDAFKKGQLWDFISFKLRNLVNLNEVEVLDNKSTQLKGFQ
jgi:hypothetical protein